jgi:hypothetical protein
MPSSHLDDASTGANYGSEDSTYGSEDSTYGSEDSIYGSEDSTYDSTDINHSSDGSFSESNHDMIRYACPPSCPGARDVPDLAIFANLGELKVPLGHRVISARAL